MQELGHVDPEMFMNIYSPEVAIKYFPAESVLRLFRVTFFNKKTY